MTARKGRKKPCQVSSPEGKVRIFFRSANDIAGDAWKTGSSCHKMQLTSFRNFRRNTHLGLRQYVCANRLTVVVMVVLLAASTMGHIGFRPSFFFPSRPVFWPSATALLSWRTPLADPPKVTCDEAGSLMESCLCCHGRPPPPPGWLPPWLAYPPCLAWERDGWWGRSAFMLPKHTCLGRARRSRDGPMESCTHRIRGGSPPPGTPS